MSTQPTAVLVHGAFADASGFAGVIRRLQAQGVPVRAPMNPLRGLASDAEAIRRYTSTIEGPIVLVGHSYGGAVISQAAPTVKDIQGLVFLSAFALDEGETCVRVAEPFPPALLATANVASPYDAPGAAGGPDLFIKIAQFREAFCADLSEDVAGPMAVSRRRVHRAGISRCRLAEPSELVPRVRAGQCDPTGLRTFHGPAHERRHRVRGRFPRCLHRPTRRRIQSDSQGARVAMTWTAGLWQWAGPWHRETVRWIREDAQCR
jgi:pimeloyl-ACP methyl ester carboxylesterase